MTVENVQKPVVLVLAGHDPTGGAGIQADMETLAELGVTSCSIITALTAQDTVNVNQVYPQPATAFANQLTTLTRDLDCINAIKVGLIGNAALARYIAKFMAINSLTCPLILDPVLAAGGGKSLASETLIDTVRNELLPYTKLITPNLSEASKLTGQTEPNEIARVFFQLGCKNILLTTADHTQGEYIVNYLFQENLPVKTFRTKRLPYQYHGTGCTLSSAITAYIAHGMMLEQAVDKAQHYVQRCLLSAKAIGKGQLIPNRLDRNNEC